MGLTIAILVVALLILIVGVFSFLGTVMISAKVKDQLNAHSNSTETMKDYLNAVCENQKTILQDFAIAKGDRESMAEFMNRFSANTNTDFKTIHMMLQQLHSHISHIHADHLIPDGVLLRAGLDMLVYLSEYHDIELPDVINKMRIQYQDGHGRIYQEADERFDSEVWSFAFEDESKEPETKLIVEVTQKHVEKAKSAGDSPSQSTPIAFAVRGSGLFCDNAIVTVIGNNIKVSGWIFRCSTRLRFCISQWFDEKEMSDTKIVFDTEAKTAYLASEGIDKW